MLWFHISVITNVQDPCLENVLHYLVSWYSVTVLIRVIMLFLERSIELLSEEAMDVFMAAVSVIQLIISLISCSILDDLYK